MPCNQQQCNPTKKVIKSICLEWFTKCLSLKLLINFTISVFALLSKDIEILECYDYINNLEYHIYLKHMVKFSYIHEQSDLKINYIFARVKNV